MDEKLLDELKLIRQMFMSTLDPDRENELKNNAFNKVQCAFDFERIDGYQFKDLYDEIQEWDLCKLQLQMCN